MAVSNEFFIAIPYNDTSLEEWLNNDTHPTQLNDGEYIGTENIQLSKFLDEVFYYAGNLYALCAVDERSGYVDRSDINNNNFFLHDDNTVLTNVFDTTPLNTGTHIWRRNNIAVQTKTIDSSSPYVGTVVDSGGNYEVYIFGDYTTKTEPQTAATWGTISSQYSASYYISVPNNSVNNSIHPQKTYSMIAGHTYTFNMYANSENNYDGIILSTSPITNWPSGLITSLGGVARCSGSNSSGTYTVSPSSNGTMYIYFRTDGSNISSNCKGRVDIIDAKPSGSEAAEWYKDNSPGCDDSYRIVVDNDEVNNDIHPVVQYPVTAGNTYRFDMETHSEIHCDGIILSYSPITYWNDSFSDMGDARCSGPYGTETEIYTPTTNGIVYIYFKTDESNILYDGTTCYGKVCITISRKNTISYGVISPKSQYCSDNYGVRSTTDGQKTFTIAPSAASCLAGSVTCTLSSVKNSSGVAQSGWTLSSNGQYIYVPSGKAAGKYTCTITASSITGSGYVGETVTRTCQITIVAVVVDYYEDIFDSSEYIPEDPDEPVEVVEHIVSNGTLLPASECTVTTSNINDYVDFDWEVDGYGVFPFSQQTVYNNGASVVYNSPSDFTISWTGEPQTFSTKGCTVDDYPAVFSSIFECYIYGRGNKSLLIGGVNDLPRENNVVTSTSTSIKAYGVPNVNITNCSALVASGGSTTVTCSVSNTQTTTTTYTSGCSNSTDNTVSGTARWRITSNGHSRFHESGTSSSLSGVGTVYNSGATLSHDSMGSNAATDSVTITAYNVDSPSKTATASCTNIVNEITWGNLYIENDNSSSLSQYNDFPASAFTLSTSNVGDYFELVWGVLQNYSYTSGSSGTVLVEDSSWSGTSKTFTSLGTTAKSSESVSINTMTLTFYGSGNKTLSTSVSSGYRSGNSEGSQQYKNEACTTKGYNITYNTPTNVSIGSGCTAGGGRATLTCTVTNSTQWYQKWTSGSAKSHTGEEAGSATWSIYSQYFNTSSNTISRFSVSGSTLSHSSMTSNEGTDYVIVTAKNAGDNTKSTNSSQLSISNSLGSQKYKDISGTTGYNITYETPIVSITDCSKFTAAGGSTTVTCSVTNSTNWYQMYTSGCYTENKTGKEAGTARWKITSDPNSRFSASGTSSSLSGVGTVYNSGGTLSHSSMGKNDATDSVTVTAYNINATSKTASASCTNIVNTHSDSWNNPTVSLAYNTTIPAGGGSCNPTVSASQSGTRTWTSGSTETLSNSSFSYGYSMTSGNGFSINTTTGVISASSRGCTAGDARSSNTATVTVTGSGSKSNTATATATQQANAITNSNYSPSDYTASISINNKSGLTAAGGSSTVTASASHLAYNYYTSGSYCGQHTVTDSVSWTITSNGGSRFTKSGDTLSHSSMGCTATTDTVEVTAVNGSSSSATATDTKSIVNEITNSNYSPSDYTVSVSIGSGLTAAGGSSTVTATASHKAYNYYTSGSYCGQHDVADTAKWRITSNGNSRFSHPSSGGSTISAGGSNITVYDSGTSVSHSSMGTNITTDTVTVTAYNTTSTSATATASKSISNAVVSISLAINGKTNSTSVVYGSSITASNIVVTGTYTSGSTGTITPTSVSSSDETVVEVL